ncbi:MAG TPA: OmpA family protein [Terriglobales bacterium]|nr:OmpA family protein [Terriglobales bacterium]
MKPSLSPRALFFFLSVMVVLVALVSLPALAQDTPPAAPSATAATSSSSSQAPPPYHPAAPAFATPKPKPAPAGASDEGPDWDKRWEVEFHGGGMLANTPTSGSSNLPNPGLTFTTFLGFSDTRQVPSFYFGDGALLTNQFVTALGNPNLTTGVTPLDPVLTNSVVKRRNGGIFGGRLSYEFSPRVNLEGTFDYSLGSLGYTPGALLNVQATSDSWQTFFLAANSPLICGPGCTAESSSSTVGVHTDVGHNYMLTGAVNINALTSGKWIPYFTVGVGLLGNTGDTPFITLAGDYQYTFGGQTYNAIDLVRVHTTVDDRSFVGIIGAGLKYYVTPRWGIRADLRDYISPNSISTLLDANGSEVQVGAGGFCAAFGVTPDIQDCNNPAVGVSTLSAFPFTNFRTFSGSGAMHQVAITAGVFYRFGGGPSVPTSASCSVSPTEVYAGEPVQASASPSGFNPNHTLNYNWTSTGGAISGTGATANVDTKGLNPGSYTTHVHVSDPKSSKATADCDATFAIKERPKHPPEISCSANPATVQSGTPSTITCSCSTPDSGPEYQPAVTTSIGNWSASAGRVSGSDGSATLDTAGVGAGPVTVSATCTDNRGLSSPGSATVNVEVAPAPPQASKVNDCEFKPKAKPARVDNECKAKLDDYALALQRDAEAKGVIVGSYDEKEGKNAKAARNLAAQRAANTKEYLVKEKGIDPGRLETRVDGASGRMVENWIVPAGASFTQEGTEVVTQKATPGAYGMGKKKAPKKTQ